MRGTPLNTIEPLTGYYGLNAIAKRMDMSVARLRTLARRYHFPLVRMPSRGNGRQWLYYTTDSLINSWFAGMIVNTRRYMLDSHPRGSNRLREKIQPSDILAQLTDSASDSSIHEVSSVQPSSDASNIIASNASEINRLDAAGGEGEGCDAQARPASPRQEVTENL